MRTPNHHHCSALTELVARLKTASWFKGRSPRLEFLGAAVWVTRGLSVVVGSIWGWDMARYKGIIGAPSAL